MRFPNPKEVERACYFGKHMAMRVCGDIVNISRWLAFVGAKSMLHKEWVIIRIVPPEKRSDEKVSYVVSYVGVTLEVDQATFHVPDYRRILLRCGDIDQLALGDYFCLFSLRWRIFWFGALLGQCLMSTFIQTPLRMLLHKTEQCMKPTLLLNP
jgi:hypothetical protein